MMQFDLLSRLVTTNTKFDRKCDATHTGEQHHLCYAASFAVGFGALWAVSDSEVLAAAI